MRMPRLDLIILRFVLPLSLFLGEEVTVAAQIGVQRLNGVLAYRAMRLVLPDILILGVSVIALVYFSGRSRRTLLFAISNAAKNMRSMNTNSSDAEANLNRSNSCHPRHHPFGHVMGRRRTTLNFTRDWDDRRRKMWRAWAVDTVCTIFTVVLICATGITSPSVTSAVYLLSFLGICTYWACRSKVNATPFASLRIFLAVYSWLHVCLYYLYQFPFFQTFCKDGDFLARLLGLYYIMQTSCDKPGEILFPNDMRVVHYIAPPLTMLLYYVLVLETRRWLDSREQANKLVISSQQFPESSNWDQNEPGSHVEPTQDDETRTLRNLTCPSIEEVHASSESTSTVKITSRASVSSLCGELNTEPSTSKTKGADIQSTSKPAQSARDTTHEGTKSVTVRSLNHEETSAVQKEHVIEARDENNPYEAQADTELVRLVDTSQTVRSKLSRMIVRRLQPHFDVLFGLTPPFLSTMYGTDNSNVRNERPLLLSLHYSAIRNSYILTLISMMAWSVTYRSWLSFILLLSACILWIMPNSRLACLYASPLIVLYAIVLILIQYVFGMNLTSEELPQSVTPDGLRLSELGMQRWENAIGALSLQITYLICFWLTLRLFVMDHSLNRLTARLSTERFYLENRPKSPAPSSSSMHVGHSPWARGFNRSPVRGHQPTTHLRFSMSEELLRGLFSLPNDAVNPGRAAAAASFGFAMPFGTVDNTAYQKFTEVLRSLCVKYWIVVCCLSMLLISLQQPVVIFRIVYMMMLIYFLFVFQVSYSFWRRQMLFFWWINVVYSMAVLLCIYTYQFQNSPTLWRKFTGLSEEVLKDIGLETFQSAALFQRLLTPVVFLVVIILQVHYFHEPFLKRSALDRFRSVPQQENEASGSLLHRGHASLPSLSTSTSLSNFMEDVNSMFQTVVSKLTSWAISLTNCCWRFLEIHWIKVIALAILLNAVNEVAAPHLISLVLMVTCFPFPYLHGFLATIMFFWTGLQVLCKMCFQLSFVPGNLSLPCDVSHNTSQMDNPTWIGLTKINDFYHYSLPMGMLMIVCVCWHAIAYRQRQFYSGPCNVRPREGIVFPQVTIDSMGYDLLNVVKFAVNYGFYKFGLELCYCITVVTACLRADAFSVLYLLLMLMFLFTPREVCARLWLPYLVILAALIPIQYAGCVGLPPGLCLTYPWITGSQDTDNLLQWLFLPGIYGSPNARKLTADFFQFVAVALQYHVFKIEQRPDAESYGGGPNRPVLANTPPGENEKDFISSKESYLDYMRHAVFYWSYWVSLAIVLATGVTWITLFCLGYMILSFIYLWMGQNVMLRKRINLIKSWNVIIGYNFCVILAKCSLQVVGCVYWTRLANQCWFVQLFGVQCMDPLSWSKFPPPAYDEECVTVSSGLHWDVFCFLFILFQRKIFMTRSFSHVVLDLNVQSQFASRGAYLINRKLMLVISEQAAREQRSLEKIREKLDVIQRRQAALGRNTANINEHYIMLRSGDYYLFEGDPEEDDIHLNSSKEQSSPSGGESSTRRPTSSSVTASRTRCSVPATTRRGTIHFSEDQLLSHSQSTDPMLPSSGVTDPQGTNNILPQDSLSALSPGFNLQQLHLFGALPNVEPSVVDLLANYTDPYTTSNKPEEDVSLTESSNNNPRSLGHRRMRSHPEYLRRNFDTPLISPSAEAPTDRLPSASHLNVVPHQLRSVRTSPIQLVDHVNLARTPARQLRAADGTDRRRTQKSSDTTNPMKRKPYQTHRRLSSASAALMPTGPSSGIMAPDASVRLVRRPVATAQTKRASFLPAGCISMVTDRKLDLVEALEMTKLPGRKSSLPTGFAEGDHTLSSMQSKCVVDGTPIVASVAPVCTTTSTTTKQSSGKIFSPVSSFDRADEEDAGQEADWDSDEGEDEDDANPVNFSASRLNPLQLLNRAMELGACSTVRHYRRSMLSQPPYSRSRQQFQVGEPGSGSNEDPHLPDGYTLSNLRPKPKHGSFAGHPHALLGQQLDSDTVGPRHMSLQHIVRSPGRLLRDSVVGQEVSTSVSIIPSVFNSESNVSQVNQSNLLGRLWRKQAHLSSLASLEDDEDADEATTDGGTLQLDGRRSSGINRLGSAPRPGVRRQHGMTEYDPPSISSYLDSMSVEALSRSIGSRYPPSTQFAPTDSHVHMESPQRRLPPNTGFRQVVVPNVPPSDSLQIQSVTATRTVRVQKPNERDISFVKRGPRTATNMLRARRSDLEDTFSESSFYLKYRLSDLSQTEDGARSESGSRCQSRDTIDVTQGSIQQREEGCWSKFKASCMIGYMFIISSVDSLIRLLNGLTRQYRRIRRTIDQEKRLVKRRLIANIDATQEHSRHHLEAAMFEVVANTTEQLQPLMRINVESAPCTNRDLPHEHMRSEHYAVPMGSTYQHHYQREKAFRQSRSHAFLLLIAMGNLAIVYSEWFCYFLLILNHMRSSTILSLPYPLTVFLWGMLSVPRPTKTFWIFLITYTEVRVLPQQCVIGHLFGIE
ncbi:Piezo-type mechanosensitive ion channel component [Fasciola hepatica]|uniref:Piezo-type mechanosensitive ion channel component n=1 Tax=Fasciola hepatica TaxID=6192 RepID=A0A4E0RU45_FASHE|nr:Piezo-type mechanosensitive ion channel component [Fasciola hepatica]